MKIKLDFVTNSSSTSYIVIIPKGFNLDDNLSIKEHSNDKDLARALLDGYLDLKDFNKDKQKQIYESITKEKIKEALKKKIEEYSPQKESAYVHQNDNIYLYYACINLFRELDLICCTFATSSEDGQIMFIFEEDVNQQLNKYKKLRRIKPNK